VVDQSCSHAQGNGRESDGPKEKGMSEYQYIAFRAIDGPVSEKNLEFMRRQSSRAEITPWTFDNEYHFGDFHGNAVEMLRRGYDLHFHYANFGIRHLMIRLPHGLPDPEAAKPYFGEDALVFIKDKKGQGGILSIDPYHEPGDLDELWEDFDDLLDRVVPARGEILDGDLRPLYLAHLAVACDSYHDPEETTEAPVPAGLDKLTKAQQALAEVYGLSKSLIAAAAGQSPPLARPSDSRNLHLVWLERQPETTKNAWLAQWIADPHSNARRQILAEFQKAQRVPSWPTVRLNRTIAELQVAAESIQHKADHKAAEKAAREQAKKLADMAADPTPTLLETERLVLERSIDAYRQVATLLADLREALASSDRSGLAEQQARKLKSEHPRFFRLISELRRRGFLPK
jgi:hypothetical protein